MKNYRVLDIYLKLLNNRRVNKTALAKEYKVNERSILRDISDIRYYLEKNSDETYVEYDRKTRQYRLLNDENQKLNNSEILAICKILLDSRAFLKSEMLGIIDKLIKQCTPQEEYNEVKEMVKNESFHYAELQHKKSFINNIWTFGNTIKRQQKIEIEYIRTDKKIVKRLIKPVGLMFSEYYFYLLGFIDKIDKEKHYENKRDVFPTIYRIDRIKNFTVLDEKFEVKYRDKFEEGEFRKKIHFMTGGKLRKMELKYKGNSLEAVLDKIPTAKIKEQDKDSCIIEVEVFGNGIDKWILSQGKDVEILKER